VISLLILNVKFARRKNMKTGDYVYFEKENHIFKGRICRTVKDDFWDMMWTRYADGLTLFNDSEIKLFKLEGMLK
jgi:hypothetical protein